MREFNSCVDRMEARRWILFSFSFLSVSTVAGVVYGWPALRQHLLDVDGSALAEQRLGAIFTVGAWSTQGGRFVTGLARDRYGTRYAACFCLVCTAAGSLGVALSDANNGAALAASLFFTGMGSGTQLCVQPVAGLFPKHAGAVLSTLSGAFQVSGLVFLVLTEVSSSRKVSFLAYTVFVLGLTAVAALLLPPGGSFLLKDDPLSLIDEEGVDASRKDPVSSVEEESTSAMEANADFATSGSLDVVDAVARIEGGSLGEEDEKAEESPTASDLQEDHPTALQQLRSKEYLGLLVWFSVCIVPLQYYVGTIGFQLEEKGDDGFYTDLFSITYASAAIVAPVGGYLADKFTLGIAHGLATLLTASSLFILATPAGLNAQISGLVFYGVGRMLTFGMYFSNVGKRFGYTNFGTLAGLGLLTSAIISLLQYPLIAWAADGHAVPVNIACSAFLMAVTPYCYWLHRQERRYGKAPYFRKNFLTGNG